MEIQYPGKAGDHYLKLKKKLEYYQAQGKLSQVKSIQYDDHAHCAELKGSGFQAKIQCKDDKILVDVDLGFLLKPMRSTIEAKLKEKLTQALSAS